MRLRFFGGFGAWDDDGARLDVSGAGQRALLFRLALDAGTTVGYRALAEDVWPADAPEDPRAALQSLVSRLRRTLPAGVVRAAPGGYLLDVPRADVDVTAFADLVAAARVADPDTAVRRARDALSLWRGEVWTPDGFDWVVRDLWEDRAHAERLAAERRPDASDAGAATPDAGAASGPGSIPAAVTTLVGRADELSLIRGQLAENRLVTLIGPGGAGKTTLALETARARGPAVLVELAPVSGGEVWDAVATALGRSIRVNDTTPVASATPRERALQALADRAVLLVLDNAEHVVAETADVVADVLRVAPACRVLVTSREPLGLPVEAFVELGPLADADAALLLTARIRAARGRELDPGERAAVARIARRLDGLPLALELAGARARVLTVDEIEAGLADRFALLARGPRSAEARHQTLRAVIDWSWELLTAAERDALLTVAVFPDGVAAEDVVAVAAAFDVDAADVDALVDRSLVHRRRGRYRLLETVREYGLDALRREGRLAASHDRQARVMASLALPRDRLLRTPDVRAAVAWFDAAEENLSAALRWSTSRPELGRTSLDLVRSQFWVWLMRERFDALSSALTEVLPAAEDLDSEPAVIVAGLAILIRVMQQEVISVPVGALDPRRVLDAADATPSDLAATLAALLRAALRSEGRGTTDQPWSLAIELRDDDLPVGAPAWSRALVTVIQAAIAQNSGLVDELGVRSERALAAFESVGDVWGLALASQMRSEWLTLQGRLEEALAVADAVSSELEGLTSVGDVIQQQSQGVLLLTRMGRIDEARARLAMSGATAERDGSLRARHQFALAAASVELAVGDGAAALRHLDGIAEVDTVGYPPQVIAVSLARRAAALTLAGDTAAAIVPLREAVPIAVRAADSPILAEIAVTLAGWFVRAGRLDDAQDAVAAADALRGRADATDPAVVRLRSDLIAAGRDPDAPRAPVPDLTRLVARADSD
ncbi:AAA family ATPase [Microbacterium sp. cx-59]|uniref:ATP-binding protein n=1 Tax=Microbacterium sp. cx-59 TaxID=2891207 RepID=UPI001E613682|nr:AAA family ATPase [Microbacterium sp. cx-59]MCC4909379.1 transcriptional regulator [Microbacterium sp. cx-59]